MVSIPQLQKDLGDMSLKLAAAVAEVERLSQENGKLSKKDNTEEERLGGLVSDLQAQVARLTEKNRKLEDYKANPEQVIVEVVRTKYDRTEEERLGGVVIKLEREIAKLKSRLLQKPEIIYKEVTVD